MLQGSEWDFILNTIKNEKCVLFLGPETCMTPEGQSFEQELVKFLNINQNKSILNYYEGEGLFLFEDPIAKTQAYYEIKDFYAREFQNDVFKKISRIPFHLIISVTPDLFFKTIMEESNIPHEFSYFDKTMNPEDVAAPTAETPLLYNLFGRLDREESLILNHDDLFDFLLAILGSKHLPNELKNSLRLADNFIFLGFKFDKWYVQLILRLLNLHNRNYKFVRYASNQTITPETKALCSEQFKIQFIEDNLLEFVDQLYRRCENEEILRGIDVSVSSTSEIISKYIEQDNLGKAFSVVKGFFDKVADQDLVDEVTVLKGRAARLKKKIDRQIIDEQDAVIDENKIIDALIGLNRQVAALEAKAVNVANKKTS